MNLKEAFKSCNIKKITAIELSVVFVFLLALGIYYSPRLWHKQEAMMAAKVKSDNAIFTSKVLEEFAQNNNIKSSEVAQKITDELNKVEKNPFDKNAPAYTFDKNCKACNSVEYDDALSMVILTSYNKKGELLARTVIKPPSFVTYNKSDDKK